jgi:hypothetical protein
MKADYWVHVHARIEPMHVFEVVAADGSYEARFRCVMKRPGELKFRLISAWRADAGKQQPIKKEDEGKFVVRHDGFAKYSVIEKATGIAVAAGFDKDGAKAEADRLNTTAKAA